MISLETPDASGNRVRREKVMVYSGSQTCRAAGSLHPVTIRTAVEATKPLAFLIQETGGYGEQRLNQRTRCENRTLNDGEYSHPLPHAVQPNRPLQ